MLDAQQLARTVEEQIKIAVDQQVQQAVNQTEWITDLEQRIIGFVQDRITARFSNIGTLPDLVQTVEQKVGELFEQGFVPDIQRYVDQDRIVQTMDLAVEKFIEDTLGALSVDPAWVTKIENLILQQSIERVRAKLSAIDLNAQIESAIVKNRDVMVDALRRDFRSQGISDHATATQLTVMDGVVVVEKELVSQDLVIERNTTLRGDVLVQGDFAVQGRINVDNKTWQELGQYMGDVTYERIKNDFARELIDTVIAQSKQGIDIENITVDGSPLISGGILSAGVIKSNLKTVGVLDNLTVSGTASLCDTVSVNAKRVGINTDDPESALSVWDEEVVVNVGKNSRNTGFVGTGRKQNLILGTNRQNHVEIDIDGVTTIQKLRIGRNNISWATEVPGYSGTKGDVVFNINAGGDNPFAWICLGAFRWQAIRAMQ